MWNKIVYQQASNVCFREKKQFYELRHNRKVDRIMVISPMVDSNADEVAKKLNIEVFSYADSVKI